MNNMPWRTKAQRDACVQQIFELNLHDSLEFYGVHFDKGRGKFALCPFHSETDGSFAVTDEYWHCFGCNETGGLIKFVSKRYNISANDAIYKICCDFKIGNLSGTNQAKFITQQSTAEIQRRIRQKKQQQAESGYLESLTVYLDAMDEQRKAYGIDPFSQELADAMWNTHKAQYNLEIAEMERSEAFSRR